MSQKSILSFFTRPKETKTREIKKQVVIEDSSAKKKTKRKVKCIESDDEADSSYTTSEGKNKSVEDGDEQEEKRSLKQKRTVKKKNGEIDIEKASSSRKSKKQRKNENDEKEDSLDKKNEDDENGEGSGKNNSTDSPSEVIKDREDSGEENKTANFTLKKTEEKHQESGGMKVNKTYSSRKSKKQRKNENDGKKDASDKMNEDEQNGEGSGKNVSIDSPSEVNKKREDSGEENKTDNFTPKKTEDKRKESGGMKVNRSYSSRKSKKQRKNEKDETQNSSDKMYDDGKKNGESSGKNVSIDSSSEVNKEREDSEEENKTANFTPKKTEEKCKENGGIKANKTYSSRKTKKQRKLENVSEHDPSDKMEMDAEENEECPGKNAGIDSSSEEVKDEVKTDSKLDESASFIPKRKTARKQINSSKSKKKNSLKKANDELELKTIENENDVPSNKETLPNGNTSSETVTDSSASEVDASKHSVSDSNDVKTNKKSMENKGSSKDIKPDSKRKANSSTKKGGSPKKSSIQNFFTPLKKLENKNDTKEDIDLQKKNGTEDIKLQENDTKKGVIQSLQMETDDSPIKKAPKRKKKIQCLESDEEDNVATEKSVIKHLENDEQENCKSQSNIDASSACDSKNENKEDSSSRRNEEKCEKNITKSKTPPEKPAGSNKNDEKPKLGVRSTSAAGTVYDPSKNHYHPIDDACWKRNEKVPYLALAKTLELIENTSGRLKTIEILSNFFRSVIVLSPDDLLQSLYLCLNRIAPEYEGIELGVGETLLMKAVAQATGRTLEKIKAEVAVKGDLGLVAESSRGNQRVMFASPKLTVTSVFSKFLEIAKMSGNAAMAKKTDKIQSLFVACRDCEARYIIRSLSGKLRIGLAEQSVLSALARAAVLTPPNQSYPPEKIDASKGMSSGHFKEHLDAQSLILKTAYCECPNYDLIIPVLLEKGISALPTCCQLSPGRPLKPMLAHPTAGIDKVLERFDKNAFTCEFKYDGERAQIHMTENGEVKIFSRNQEDNTTKYPDVISRISKCVKESTKSFILDSEAVAWDTETKQILPFQVLSTRKRKDAVESEIVVKVCIMAFDLLYLNGESLVKKSLKERRSLLHSSFNEVENEFMFAQYRDGDSAETMQEFLDESVKGNCEGLMVKALEVDASYEIAKRSHNWLKLKKDYLQGVGDTLDLVVIGGYYGKGKRTGNYGGFLLACFDDDNEEFQSICKLGTGFKDDNLEAHTTFLKQHVINEPKSYYRYDHSLEPDVWFEPIQVWEIKCADLSISPVHKAAMGIVDPEKGISLRFPRFIRIRDDKTPESCTNSIQIAGMYNQQQQIQNTNKNTKIEEDYY